MIGERAPFGSRIALSAAVRRFPKHEFAIRRYIVQSDEFFEICNDLADAETALSEVNATPMDLREARRIEWQEVIEMLTAEIAAFLEGAPRLRIDHRGKEE